MASIAVAGSDQRETLEPFVLERFDGEPVDLDTYRGRVVVVNFWATWCPPCIAEFPSLVELKESLADEPFEILAINMGEDDFAIEGFLDFLQPPVNFPILVDRPQITVAERWRLQALPSTVIVDKAGKHFDTVIGERDWSSEESRQSLLALLRE